MGEVSLATNAYATKMKLDTMSSMQQPLPLCLNGGQVQLQILLWKCLINTHTDSFTNNKASNGMNTK